MIRWIKKYHSTVATIVKIVLFILLIIFFTRHDGDKTPRYFKDDRTNLCFAMISLYKLTTVPCNNKVIELTTQEK